MTRSLCRPEIAAEREGGQDVALPWISQLRLGPGQRPEVAYPLGPEVDVGQDIQQAALWHSIQQRCLERLRRGQGSWPWPASEDRFTSVVDADVDVGRKASINALRGLGEPNAQASDELMRVRRNAELAAVVSDDGLASDHSSSWSR